MDRLYRSRTDRMFAGVAAGLAERIEADPALVRIAWAVLVFVTGGFALLVYIIMAFVVPEGPARGGAAPQTDISEPDGAPGPIAQPPARRGGNGGATIVFGLALVVIGGALLLERVMPAFDLGALWPVLLIGLGAVLIVGSVRRSA